MTWCGWVLQEAEAAGARLTGEVAALKASQSAASAARSGSLKELQERLAASEAALRTKDEDLARCNQ